MNKKKNILIALGWMTVGYILSRSMGMLSHQQIFHNLFMKSYDKARMAEAIISPGVAELAGAILYFFLPFIIGYPISIYLYKKYSLPHGKWMAIFLAIFTIITIFIMLI